MDQSEVQTLPAPWFYRISPKIHVDDSDNVGNKSLCGEEQIKFSKKSYLQWGLDLGP